METKLTLKLDEKVIAQAKRYAKSKKISLSKLIERYLDLLILEDDKIENYSPLVDSLTGVIDLSNVADEKEGYADFLAKKYT